MSSAPFPELSHSDRSTQGHSPKGVQLSTTSISPIMAHPPPSKAQQVTQREPPPPISLQQPPSPQPSVGSTSKKSSPGSTTTPTHHAPPQPGHMTPRLSNASTFNPLIYGNDVDSVDVATRIAMVIYPFFALFSLIN